MGRLWAKVVPNWSIFGISLNPGPFTIKEHVLVTIMATVGYQSAYAVCTLYTDALLLILHIGRCRRCPESLLSPSF